MRQRVINEMDEPLVLEPGDCVELLGREETRRVMSQRKTTLRIEEVEQF